MVLRPEDFPDFVEEPAEYVREPGEPDVTAHLMTPQADGVANFPIILHAYILNRFGKKSEELDVQVYQKQLREYRIGQFITEAVDLVYDKDRESTIDPALRTPMRDNGGVRTKETHWKVIDAAKDYLPPGVNPEYFLDPPYEDQAAA